MSYLVDVNKNSVNIAGDNTTYTLTATDEIYIAVDNQTVKLPDPAPSNNGRTYTIKLSGVYTNGVLVKSLDELTTYYTINKDYGSVNIISNGVDWIVLADAIRVSEIATTTYVTEATWTHAGVWNDTDTYQINDVVVYDGSTWLALQVSTNSTPAENADWTLIAAKGQDGADGLPGQDGASGADGQDGVSIVSTSIFGGDLFIEYSNDIGNPTLIGTVVGADGAPGQDGAPGIDGAPGQDGLPGADGVSIISATIDIDGDLLIEYSNNPGSPTNVGHVVGADGADGTNGADAVWYFQGAWSNVDNYVTGDIVTYQGQTWYAVGANNNSPPFENADWTLIASSAFVEDWLPIVDTDPTAGGFAGIGVGDRGLLIRGDSNTSPVALYYDDSVKRVYLKAAQANQGADFYLEAGNATADNGGKIRLYGGDALAGSNGHGGYIRLRGGETNDANIVGGYVELQGGNSVLGNGGYIDLTAGQSYGGSNANGGYVNIAAGTGDAIGGEITLTAGQGVIGGQITIHGGLATNGTGGAVTIEGGYASGVGNTSGAINISSGEIGVVAGAIVGDVNIFTPNADNDGQAGDVNITAGNSGGTVSIPGGRAGGSINLTAGYSTSDLNGSVGGSISLTTGDASANLGVAQSANAGSLNLTTGSSPIAGNGGDITIITGSGSQDGGDVNITTGNGTAGTGGGFTLTLGNGTTGDGGLFSVTAGNSTDGDGGSISLNAGQSTNVDGGSVSIYAGNSANVNGGAISLYAGQGEVGEGGSITIEAGDTSNGNAGSITLNTGSTIVAGNGGDLNLQTGQGAGLGSHAGNIILTPGDVNGQATAGNVQVQSDLVIDGSLDVNTILLGDNEALALDITDGTNTYLKFETTDGFEKVVVAKNLDVRDSLENNVFTVDSTSGDTTISGDLTVTGSLIVNGSTTTINTINLNVTDSLIQLADGTAGAPVNDAGFIVARGSENNASLFWNEANTKFIFATATSLSSDFSGNILTAGGTITYSAVRLGSLEANSIGGITGGGTLSITGELTGNADTSTSWLNAMTLNLGGDLTGSVAFNGSSAVTLNATLGTITNAQLENSSINIGGSNIALGETLNLSDLAVTGSTLGLNIGNNVITNSNLVNSSINIGGSNISLGGTLALSNDFSIDGGTLILGGTLSVYSTGAIALAKTINLAGAITGSIDLNDQTSAVTLNTTLGTVSNASLEYDSVRIGSYDLVLGGTLNLDGGLSVTGSTLSVGNVATASALATAVTLSIGGSVITGSVSFDGSTSVEILADVTPNSITGGMIANSTITNTNLEYPSVNIDGYSLALGGTLNVAGDSYITLGVTGSTLSASLGTVDNAKLQYDSINIGGSNIALGGTLALSSDFAIDGGTLVLGGTLSVYSTGAIALAKTINLAGAITGSIDLNNQTSAVTLNTSYSGTITNASLEYDSINIGGSNIALGGTLNLSNLAVTGSTLGLNIGNNVITNSNLVNSSINIDGYSLALGGTLNVAGDSYITLGVTGSTLSASLGTIDNAKLQYDSVRLGSYDLALGGTLNLSGLAITGSTLGLSIGSAVITNDNLVNDSVSIGGSYDLVLGGTLNLENLTITGSTLSLATTINLTDEAASALEFAEGANTYLKFITTGGAEEVYLGKPISLSQINLTDNQATALDITEGANSYLKFVTTDSSEKVIFSKTLQVNDGSNNPVFSVNNSNGNTLITGNLTINGTTTTVNSSTVTIDDPIFTLGGDGVALTNDSKDRGIEFKWNDGTSAITPDTMINGSTYYIVTLGNTDFTQIGAASNTVGLSFVFNGSISQIGTTGTAVISTALKTGFFGYDNSSSAFTFIQDATNSSEVFSGDVGNVVFGSGTFKGTVSLQTFGGLERAVYNPVTGLTLKNSNDFSITSDANGNTSVFSVIGATGNTTIKGTLDLNEGNITNVGSISLDSISADATSIAINLTDNQASALNITEGANSYLKFVTTDAAEKVVVGKTLDVSEGNIINVGDIALDSISADASSIAINLTDNQASALDITQSTNSYLKFVTTDSSEKVIVGKDLEVSANSSILIKKATTATDPLMVLNSDTTLVANAQTAVLASVERGSNATSDAQIIWDEDYLAWKLQNSISEQKIIQTKSPIDATITTSNTALSANNLDELEKIYLVENSNTAIDITLFEIGNLTDYTGYKVIIKKIDNGTGAITVKPYTGNTVDGANSSTGVTISTGYGSLTLIAYGSAWYVL